MSGPESIEVRVGGERLVLRASRSAYWPGGGALMVADLHLGKPAAFAAAGVAVPSAVTEADLDRLSSDLHETGAQRLVILGDLFHARRGQVEHTLSALAAWRSRHPRIEVLLVRGNHDQRAGDPPESLGIRTLDEPVADGPWVFTHGHGWGDTSAGKTSGLTGHVVGGHVHPVVRLRGAGGAGSRHACFVVGVRRTILPAFGAFTGGAPAEAEPGDRIFAVHGGEVAEVRVVAVSARRRRVLGRRHGE